VFSVAGMSEESGIPTFRDWVGSWTVTTRTSLAEGMESAAVIAPLRSREELTKSVNFLDEPVTFIP